MQDAAVRITIISVNIDTVLMSRLALMNPKTARIETPSIEVACPSGELLAIIWFTTDVFEYLFDHVFPICIIRKCSGSLPCHVSHIRSLSCSFAVNFSFKNHFISNNIFRFFCFFHVLVSCCLFILLLLFLPVSLSHEFTVAVNLLPDQPSPDYKSVR